MTPKEAKNYVSGTLERDQPYERLLRQVVLEGELTTTVPEWERCPRSARVWNSTCKTVFHS